MNSYKATIGLEIHAELKTASKMFCGCKNDPKERLPNVNICPICMAHPGTLPVVNHEAVRQVARIGAALNGKIADFTEFDRKNYFYPDIPKGYQISQYKYPIVSGGVLNGVEITRVHLEEDTARTTHDKGDHSLVDFNRAGVPLMELVTEPVIKTPEEASAFAKELQLLLRYLGASDANMEEGLMRVEANVSVGKGSTLGTKVEVKNLNSFKSVERAIKFEIERQSAALEKGEKLIQETRGWDENKEETFSQRAKESSHDYRYFPDPDIPKLKLSELKEFSEKTLKESLPELPWQRREVLINKYLLKKETAELFITNEDVGRFFNTVVKKENNKELIKLASNYISSDVAGLLEKGEKIPDTQSFIQLINMVLKNEVSSAAAKMVLAELCKGAKNTEAIVKEKGLLQKSGKEDLEKIAKKVIEANKKAVDEYRAGKQASLQFLVGQGMKESSGAANPQVLREVFEVLLKNVP